MTITKFNKWLGKLEIHRQKHEVGPLHTISKNSKWIDLKCREKTIKLLEQNTGENLHDHKFGNDFLDMISKAHATKEKQIKLDLIQI